MQFRELVGKRVKSGQEVGAVAKERGLVKLTLRNWVKAAKAGKLNASAGKTITPGEMELLRVRAENARLLMEREIIREAAAYLAKDVR